MSNQQVQYYASAVAWRNATEEQISKYVADRTMQGNLMRGLEKTWMYLSEFVPDEVKKQYARDKRMKELGE